jgi:hypothetical protein
MVHRLKDEATAGTSGSLAVAGRDDVCKMLAICADRSNMLLFQPSVPKKGAPISRMTSLIVAATDYPQAKNVHPRPVLCITLRDWKFEPAETKVV